MLDISLPSSSKPVARFFCAKAYNFEVAFTGLEFVSERKKLALAFLYQAAPPVGIVEMLHCTLIGSGSTFCLGRI